jgi:hypothetical protein
MGPWPLGLLLVLCLAWSARETSAQTLQLHPVNPHCFLWRGKPTVLITSGEHYGAVLNLDFDYGKYLDTLAADRLNLTRTFAGGAYFEPSGAFHIAGNTLAPASGRYLSPWGRSERPGYVHGGNKFDLTRWNEAYYARLRDFVQKASQKGVVVELNLFCPFYDESQWQLSPFNTANNVNAVGGISRTNVYTLDRHGGLLPFEERVVQRIVQELRDFDNVYYEICNEPYFGGVTLEWQRHMAAVIQQAQMASPQPKLISQNIANQSAKVENPDPHVSIFNFHYATPPVTVDLNYSLNRALGDNETGFRGTNNLPYRVEAWEFLLAGGGLFNNLDYSFTAGHEDGTFVYPASQPGSGNPQFRKELRVLVDFINSFDFVRMKPDKESLHHPTPDEATVRVLSEPGKAYAIYMRRQGRPGPTHLELELPAGIYTVDWISPTRGAVEKSERLTHPGGIRNLLGPPDIDEIAVAIRAALTH